jgi:hypothetical protein
MGLPSVSLPRQNGQLNLTAPSEDALICYVISGQAVAGKIGLSVPTQIFSPSALDTLGITSGNNLLAYKEINAFYAIAGEGAELNFMLVSATTSLTTICDKTSNILKSLIDSTSGRAVIVLANRTLPGGYTFTAVNGLDPDITTAAAKLNELAAAYDADNIPFVGILPGIGFSPSGIADMPIRSTLTNDYVAISLACDLSDGLVSLGTLAGWISKLQVHQNIGFVGLGSPSAGGFFPDGSSVMSLKDSLGAIHDKGYIIYRKVGQKSGYFFNDDPTFTSATSDYNSISWNRVINKAKRLAFGVLVEKLNGDIEINENTGEVETTILSDWESDVETAIRNSMIKVAATKSQEISGVKCTVDANSDILNNNITGSLQIVRKGQAKNITFSVSYATTI